MTGKAEFLRAGIDSEYFLACFLKGPASGYALGKIVQNRQKPNPKTVYSVIGRLCKTKHLKKDENGFSINSEQLVEEIYRNLKKKHVVISAKEKKILAGILQNKGPFVFVSDWGHLILFRLGAFDIQLDWEHCMIIQTGRM